MEENATASKEAKTQTLANMRDKKGVSLVPIGERLQSIGNRLRMTGASIVQRPYITQGRIHHDLTRDRAACWEVGWITRR
jgi:hypothetical protein